MDGIGFDAFDLGYFRGDTQLSELPQNDLYNVMSESPAQPYNLSEQQLSHADLVPVTNISGFAQQNAFFPKTEGVVSRTRGPFDIAPNQPVSDPIKSVQSDIDDDFDCSYEEEEPNPNPKKRSASKAKMSAEQKLQKRNKQSRDASRLYRERKKALEQQLKENVEQLQKEKESLLEQSNERMKKLIAIKAENQKLKKDIQQKAKMIETNKHALLKHLDDQLKSNAPDEALLQTMNEITESGRNGLELGQHHLQQLVTPSLTQQLVQSGLFEGTSQIESLSKSENGSVEEMCIKIKKCIPTLSEDQNQLLDRHNLEHKQRLKVLHDDREKINNDITNYFEKKGLEIAGTEHSSSPKLELFVEIASSLESLRKSLSDEANEWTNTMQQLLSVLVPRQRAQFFLTIEFQHSSVRQLASFWKAMNSEETIPPPTGIIPF